ncbi:uncharacterized protein [Engystomops pustulosus]|uniref:uncharacterized protein n=1 Tax=Engystomops pustulosus TaxID=76066 RepID=UPI003AFA9913
MAKAEMILFITNIFLITFFFSFAADQECYECHARNSGTCNATVTKCQAGEKCIIINEEFICNGTYRSFYKGCSRNVPCDWQPYAKANTGFSYRIYTKCCSEDRNNGSYEMPEPQEPSGVRCPGCFTQDTLEGCKSDGDMECRGTDDKCHTSYSTVLKPDDTIISFSFQGCISPKFCETDLGHLIGLQVLNSTVFTCTDPAKPVGEEDKNNEGVI